MQRALPIALVCALTANTLLATPTRTASEVFKDEAATKAHCAAIAEGLLRANEADMVARFSSAFSVAVEGLREEAAALGDTERYKSASEQLAAQMSQAAVQRFAGTLRRIRRSPALDHEHARTDRLGSAFVRHIFIARFEETGVRLDCDFYRGKDGWLLRPWMPVEEARGVFDSGDSPRPAQPMP